MKTLSSASKIILPVLLLLLTAKSFAQGDINLENEDNRIGYAIGLNIGQNLVDQNILEGVDMNSFVGGILDAVSGEPQLTEEEIFAAIQTFQTRLNDQAQAALAGNLAESAAFLAENATKDGVVSLESGLQYEVMVEGPAGPSPAATDAVLAHYHGTLTDGSVFDSSVDRGEPAQFGLSQVIPGWTEALQLMKIGDKWRLFIPPNLAYGEASPTPAIPPNSALVFEVEILEIR